MTNTAVTKKKDNVVSLSSSDWEEELASFAGAGFEDVRPEDLSMPFFRLLQALSPETKRSDSAYVDGAQEGMWLDVVARTAYDSIIFVPSRYVTHYIEWKPRSEGGGLVANHGTDRSVLDRCHRDPNTGRDVTPNGNEIVTTGTWYGIVVSGEVNGQTYPIDKEAIIAFSGTQRSVSSKWLSDAGSIRAKDKNGKTYTPPMFCMTYRLYSVPKKNDRGSWALSAFERVGATLELPQGRELFLQARAFWDVSKDLQPATAAIDVSPQPAADIPF